jgi:oligopeptide transport system substrate-binding protein
MKNVVLSLMIISSLLIFSCGGSDSENIDNDGLKNESVEKTNQCLDFAISEKYNTLDPILVTSVVSFHIVSQIYEPLLRFDEKSLVLKPLLVESWEVSEDHLTHTFYLKKGIHFQDNACFKDGKGRELKASDVIYTFQRIYSEKSSYSYSLFRNTINGGEEFQPGGDIAGLKMIDDYTVEFTLNKPSSNFMNLLAGVSSAIVAKEAIEKNAVSGSGPFMYNKKGDTEQAITLTKNGNYHISDKKGNKLPYLSCVSFNYVNSGKEQLDMFMDEKLDVITGIPPESIKEIVESQIADFQDKPTKYILGRHPQESTTFLNLNTAIAPFNNIKVRKAVAMAIDKNKIVADVLKGEAYGPGDHGIVPPAIKNYDFASIVGQEFSITKAKELLASAGYPNGKGFPTLIFATGKGNTSLRVALDIQKQLLANLNINLEISSLSLKKITEMNNKSQINLSLSGWLGEFPDPVAFLSLFYGVDVPESHEEPSYPNASRYSNDKFDKLYEQALITIDSKKRYELCLSADQIIASDVPVIPLWYHENYRLTQSAVQDYHPNSMNIQYLTYVKIKDITSEKKE